jgi:hypothetical protein
MFYWRWPSAVLRSSLQPVASGGSACESSVLTKNLLACFVVQTPEDLIRIAYAFDNS